MIFGPKPPPTNGATTRTCDSSRPSIARQAVADRDRRLRRVPDGQLLGAGVPLRDDRAILDRRDSAAVVEEPPRDDESACARARCVVALASGPRGPRHSTSRSLVHERRARRQRRLEVDDRVERLDVDDDVANRVFGDVAALGDDHRDRFADVADLLARERQLRPRVKHRAGNRRRRDQERRRRAVVAEIGGRVDGDHARPLHAPPRRRRRDDARVRVRRCARTRRAACPAAARRPRTARGRSAAARLRCATTRALRVDASFGWHAVTASTMCW